VDLKTQLSFQQLDPTFIGLIYSCFHETKSLTQKLSVICFQTKDDQQLDIPFTIVPSKLKDIELFNLLKSIIHTYYLEELEEEIKDPVSISTVGTNILKIQRNLLFPLLRHLNCQ
jgi:hypothetical protein